METPKLETATLAAGCFWCVEAVFDDLVGVDDVVSGYSGGHTENPTYQEVCSERTGHAEVVQIRFDPEQLSFKELLQVFLTVHDPTTLNRQGNDVGSSYRSAVFYRSEAQKQVAEQVIAEMNAESIYENRSSPRLRRSKSSIPLRIIIKNTSRIIRTNPTALP